MRPKSVFSMVMAGIAGVALAAGAVLPGAGPAGADVTSVDGGAFGVQVGVTLLGASLVSVGPTPTVTLPATGGGPISNSLASVNAAGILTTAILNVTTQGGNLGTHAGTAQSSATAATVKVLTNALTADLISSSCTSNGDGSSGLTTLANANVLGTGVIAANPAPNTTLSVAGVASITFNEQIVNNVPGQSTSITVNAVHVHLNALVGTGDIIISQSVCSAAGPDVLTAAQAPTGNANANANPAQAINASPKFTG